MPKTMAVRLAAACALCTVSTVSVTTEAAGLFYVERGVRPLGRGGAFIAGADDAGAITFNPAGIAAAGQQLLIDAAWVNFESTYQRQATLYQVDPNTGLPTGTTFSRTYPAVNGTTPFIPIPSIAYTHPLSPRATIGAGIWAPYATLTSYPAHIGTDPAPQRYSLLNMDGSALAVLGLYGAYKVTDELSLGAGVEVLGGVFKSSLVFSACLPERFLCAPEQPEYDAPARVAASPILAPSGIVGARYALPSDTHFGLSFHLPYWISAPSTVDVDIPTASVFRNASQRGKDATVSFRLPWILRAGIEQRFGATRAEVAYVHEHWSMHDRIDVEPHGITLNDVVSLPASFSIPSVSMRRGFRDTHSVRFGLEQGLKVSGTGLDVRGGVMYETGAIPNESISVTTLDLDKVVLGLGASVHVTESLRLDFVFAHVFTPEVKVDPDRAAIEPVNPLESGPPRVPHTINGGTYSTTANVFGLGLRYAFEPAEEGKRSHH